jgi:preprotein translocase subunit YajC
VVTTSGIFGFITGEDGDKFWLEIDDDVQIRIARAAVQNKVETAAPATDDEDDDQADEADDIKKSENS